MGTPQTPVYEAAEEMMHLMLAQATGGIASAPDYKRVRTVLLADESTSSLVPRFVRTCRDPDAFWAFIKAKHSGSGSYEARREFLRTEFEPLLTALERFEASPVDDLVAESAEVLGSASVIAAWDKALQRRHHDPEGAITAARTLLEAVCKTILDDLGGTYASTDDLPKLYRDVSKALNLAPSDQTEDQFKRILGGATSVVEGLGSLRNRQGDAHGQGRKAYRASARHANLAVNLAGSMALFLMETAEERQSS
jgi:Abortive infection C-terminus